jgi:hypothetical protein
MARDIYDIRTNLPPEAVNRIGLELFERWMSFAMGGLSLGSKRLIYPTGRYAASLSYRREGEATVALIADEAIAPEAGILEHGHGPVDLKTRLQHGVAYKMHRWPGSTRGTTLRRIGARPAQPRVWAVVRDAAFSGYAAIGPHSAPDSWIIPAMPAYSPALTLAQMARRMTGGV